MVRKKMAKNQPESSLIKLLLYELLSKTNLTSKVGFRQWETLGYSINETLVSVYEGLDS